MRQQCWRPRSRMAAIPPSMWSCRHAGPVCCSTSGSSWARCAAAALIPNSHNAHGSKDGWLPSAMWASACELFSDPTVSQGAVEKEPLSYQEMGESGILLQAFWCFINTNGLKHKRWGWNNLYVYDYDNRAVVGIAKRSYKGEQNTCPFFR